MLLPPYLDRQEVPETVDASSVGEAEQPGGHAWRWWRGEGGDDEEDSDDDLTTEDHSEAEEIPEIHTFGHKATKDTEDVKEKHETDLAPAEHEEGVGEEIGGVQEAEVGLGLLLALTVNLKGEYISGDSGDSGFSGDP